jgi:hypothetical protein
MKHVSNDRGAVSVLAIVLVLAVVAAVGVAIFNVSRVRNNDTQSANSSSPAHSPASTASPADNPTAAWTPFSAKIGKYSLRYKPGWKTRYCSADTYDSLQFELASDRLIGCNTGGENAPIQMLVYTSSGNHLADYDVAEAGFNGTKTDVVKDGAAGHRYEGVKDKHTTIDYPPVGTRYIKYVFATNGRTYQFEYHQQRGDTDASADFELMVKSTLKFSS